MKHTAAIRRRARSEPQPSTFRVAATIIARALLPGIPDLEVDDIRIVDDICGLPGRDIEFVVRSWSDKLPPGRFMPTYETHATIGGGTAHILSDLMPLDDAALDASRDVATRGINAAKRSEPLVSDDEHDPMLKPLGPHETRGVLSDDVCKARLAEGRVVGGGVIITSDELHEALSPPSEAEWEGFFDEVAERAVQGHQVAVIVALGDDLRAMHELRSETAKRSPNQVVTQQVKDRKVSLSAGGSIRIVSTDAFESGAADGYAVYRAWPTLPRSVRMRAEIKSKV